MDNLSNDQKFKIGSVVFIAGFLLVLIGRYWTADYIYQTRISMYLELAQFNPEYLQLAVNLIKDTVPLSPTDPKLELYLGKAYANMGQIKNAEFALEKALELKPDYAEAKKDLEIVQK